MRIRRNFLPRQPVDIVCCLIIPIFLPILYAFEMTVVLPAFHLPWSFVHTFTAIMSLFIVFNINGNLLACILADTSVANLKDYKEIDTRFKINWRYCKDCAAAAPPRSWHCKACKTCILKRDHHCYFTGCCIGFHNHRYFLMFVAFLFIGSIYAFIYNSLYFWVLKGHIYRNWLSALKMVCPVFYFLNGSRWENFYLVLYNINILAVVYSVALTCYHLPIVVRGGVCHEHDSGCAYAFDFGWRKNLQDIFGERMQMVWLSPFVESKLLHHGIEWKRNDAKCKSE